MTLRRVGTSKLNRTTSSCLRTSFLAVIVACVAILMSLARGPAAGAQAAAKGPFFVTFVPGNPQIIVADHDGRLVLLGVPGLNLLREFHGDASLKLMAVALSADGRWLAADYAKGDLRVWNLQNGERYLSIPHAQRSSRPVFLFDPNDNRLLLSQDGHLESWDLTAQSHRQIMPSVIGASRMSLSGDGTFFVVSGFRSCRVGRNKHDLCVLSYPDGMVVARGNPPSMPGTGVFSLQDLTVTDDNQIFLVIKDSTGVFESFRLALADLRVLRTEVVVVSNAERVIDIPNFWKIRGLRSAPRDQWRALSADGQWAIHLSSGASRLYLYSIPEQGGWDAKKLAKFILLP